MRLITPQPAEVEATTKSMATMLIRESFIDLMAPRIRCLPTGDENFWGRGPPRRPPPTGRGGGARSVRSLGFERLCLEADGARPGALDGVDDLHHVPVLEVLRGLDEDGLLDAVVGAEVGATLEALLPDLLVLALLELGGEFRGDGAGVVDRGLADLVRAARERHLEVFGDRHDERAGTLLGRRAHLLAALR